jgi:NAD(P)-dependent dehydrogenase (short-subunit alcohol dehydrogenase family)
VVLGARDLATGERVAVELTGGADSPRMLARRLDVTDAGGLRILADDLRARLGRIDILVNNAAVHYDTWQRASTADLGIAREAMETNLFGAWLTTQTLLPLLRASRHARIVNVSSEAGSLAAMDVDAPAYRVSKAALNAFTRTLAADLAHEGILVNAVCPGWIATDMGGPGGGPVSGGAESVLWAVDLPDDGPSGGFFRHGDPLPW